MRDEAERRHKEPVLRLRRNPIIFVSTSVHRTGYVVDDFGSLYKTFKSDLTDRSRGNSAVIAFIHLDTGDGCRNIRTSGGRSRLTVKGRPRGA